MSDRASSSSFVHNLPPLGPFVGRAAEKALVHDALRSRATLVSIGGPEGMGKTILVLVVAHECLRAEPAQALFDACVWTSAADRALTLDDLLNTILRTLGYPGLMQRTLDDKRRATLDLLQTKPTLLIVDSVDRIADPQLTSWLLSWPAPSAAIITSPEHKLLQAWPVTVKGLVEADAVNMVRLEGARLGLTAIEQAPSRELLRLCQAVRGVPLAIKWAVGGIKHSAQTLDEVAADLGRVQGDLCGFLWRRAWNGLSADAQRVALAMPLFVAPPTRASLEAASDVHDSELEVALEQLVDLALIEAVHTTGQPPRYSVHPVARAFTRALSSPTEPDARESAGRRLAEHYRSRVARHETHSFLEIELLNILSVVRQCWEQNRLELGASLFFGVADWMMANGYQRDAARLSQRGAKLAVKAGDDLMVARFQAWSTGWRHRRQGDIDPTQLAQALELFEQSGQAAQAAQTRCALGDVAQAQGNPELAEKWFKEALVTYQSVHDQQAIYTVTARLGQVALTQGYWDAAWAMCHGVLASARQSGSAMGIADLLVVLGAVAHRRADLEQAHALWAEALDHIRQANRRDAAADLLFKLAQLDIRAGQEEAARRVLAEALDTYRRLDARSKAHEVETILARLQA